MAESPFIYGRPVRSGEFVDRESELRTIFNRLRNGESTAVVGEPHIGKTSLLLQLTCPDVQKAYLGDSAKCLMFSYLDLHPINSDYNPSIFWEEALECLQLHPGHRTTASLLKRAAEEGYTRRSLERLFTNLSAQGRRLVLLLDEFERLLFHPNFQDPSFFPLLRALATRAGGLSLITASRLSVAEMNERGERLLNIGSPFFNNVIEVRLHPFNEVIVSEILDRAGDLFSSDDRRFIRRVAGRHPFLLQAMAAALIEAEGEDRYDRASERFYEQVSFHFDDLWRTLDDRTRTAAVILSLVELGGRALGRNFAFGEIERVEAFGPELRKLAERGWAERVSKGWQFDTEHLLLWQGERWTVSAQAFVWWVRDVAIARTRRVQAYEEWLANKRYRCLLTQEQWDKLMNTVSAAPGWMVRGVAALGRALFEELIRKR